MCRVQLKDRKRANDLLVMLGLSETIDQISMANIVHYLMLRRTIVFVLKRVLDFEVEGHRKKGRLKCT